MPLREVYCRAKEAYRSEAWRCPECPECPSCRKQAQRLLTEKDNRSASRATKEGNGRRQRTDGELALAADGHAGDAHVPALDDLTATEGEDQLHARSNHPRQDDIMKKDGKRMDVQERPWCWNRTSCHCRVCQCSACRPSCRSWRRVRLPSSSRGSQVRRGESEEQGPQPAKSRE